jgi:ubiquinone/menaquinone biosynthesis C-methylase UbiE
MPLLWPNQSIQASSPHYLRRQVGCSKLEQAAGRLTAQLAAQYAFLIAIEPSAGLARVLRSRLSGIRVVAAWGEALPLPDGWSELTVAYGLVWPDSTVLAELARVTEIGGEIVLINPEQPEWFECNGWRRMSVDPLPSPPHESWIDNFFGPL